jgi:hypothetical protein
MIRRLLPAAVAAVLLVLIACSGEEQVGGPCDREGLQDGECVINSLCGKDTDGALRCLRICKDKMECPADFDCEGIGNSSFKGCRFKK